MRRLFFACTAAVLLGACSNFGYYVQSIDGQLNLLLLRQPIAQVIADPATPAPLKARLERTLEIREFASRELKLPDNASYRGYADVRRPYVVWNVFAASEFSVEPEQWCFLVTGCVGYRGYFSYSAAEQFARELHDEEGLDVFVSNVPAYSTLGWFDDPVLNTFINYPEYELARLVFHELAHQIVYIKGDTEFNESFAVAVEAEGVRRWIVHNGDEKVKAEFELAQQRRAEFRELMSEYRQKLAASYRLRLPAQEMRARKTQIFSSLRSDYEALKVKWGGYSGYDRFFDGINNAHMASFSIYDALVPQFLEMLAKHNGDLAAFYSEVKQLSTLGKKERASRLAALEPAR